MACHAWIGDRNVYRRSDYCPHVFLLAPSSERSCPVSAFICSNVMLVELIGAEPNRMDRVVNGLILYTVETGMLTRFVVVLVW